MTIEWKQICMHLDYKWNSINFERSLRIEIHFVNQAWIFLYCAMPSNPACFTAFQMPEFLSSCLSSTQLTAPSLSHLHSPCLHWQVFSFSFFFSLYLGFEPGQLRAEVNPIVICKKYYWVNQWCEISFSQQKPIFKTFTYHLLSKWLLEWFHTDQL